MYIKIAIQKIVHCNCCHGTDLSLRRGRYSNVQNNVVRVTLGRASQYRGVPWFTPLQPLAHKDGKTLATAILQVILPLVKMCLDSKTSVAKDKPRVLHLLIGDGINTNEYAARIVFNFILNNEAYFAKYFLVLWKCCSHKVNLCIMVAIGHIFCCAPRDIT